MRNGLRQFSVVLIIIGIAFACAVIAAACPYHKCLSIIVGQLVTNSLSTVNEIHGYSVTVEENDVLLIRINSTSGGWDPAITLLHPTGYIMFYDGSPGSGRAEILTSKLTTSDSYDLLVQDFLGGRQGEYNLTVQAVNRPANAELMRYDDFRRDSIVACSQIRSYRFEGDAGNAVSVEMIGVTPDLQPHVRLFGPDGELLAGDSDDDFALLSNIRLHRGGMYTIIATDADGDDLGEYFLVLLRSTTDADDDDGLPAGFSLKQNRPNPFNPQTDIAFTLPRGSFVTVDIYNVAGECVRRLLSRNLPAGEHQITWDGRDQNGVEASSGVYFYRLTADEFSASKKMLLLR